MCLCTYHFDCWIEVFFPLSIVLMLQHKVEDQLLWNFLVFLRATNQGTWSVQCPAKDRQKEKPYTLFCIAQTYFFKSAMWNPRPQLCTVQSPNKISHITSTTYHYKVYNKVFQRVQCLVGFDSFLLLDTKNKIVWH